jgi:hypothetical protein
MATKRLAWLVGIAIVFGALCLALYFSGFIEAFISGFEGHGGMPSCDSSHGKSDAKQAIENAPFAKSYGITIVAITDAKTISADTHKVDCKAMVILNSSKGASWITASQWIPRCQLDNTSSKHL